MFRNFSIKIFFLTAVILFLPSITGAFSVGQIDNFNIDENYDFLTRREVPAVLQRITNKLYLYVEKDWWNQLDYLERNKLDQDIYNLSIEFESKIYPELTSFLGSEPKPAINNDEKITILFHQMKKEAAGYFNSADQYSRYQSPKSNERNMLYLNTRYIEDDLIKSNLAHEFVHLITFNQKEKLRKVTEEVWLNESRAEYAITFLGYDAKYEGSNLEKRVKSFLRSPNTSLTEWTDKAEDYGVINLFIQYLADHYGQKILSDSLKSDKIGIESINYALSKNKFKENFNEIFTNWTIAVFLNDCSLGDKYCYSNPNLKNIKLPPLITYLPYTESALTANYNTKNWTGNWHKIIGGKGNLTFSFEGDKNADFKIPYIICDYQNKCSVYFIALDENQKGGIVLDNFNLKYSSFSVIPSIQKKLSGFNGEEQSFPFALSLAISSKKQEEENENELLKQQLLARIDELREEISRLEEMISLKQKGEGQSFLCQKIENNLYFGLMDNSEVRCLQEFLKKEGSEIYPEGLVTGNFLSLTKLALIRFQEKHTADILIPLGLKQGTGFFGELTRNFVNKIIRI